MHLATLAPDFNLMCWLEELAASDDSETEQLRCIGSPAWRKIVAELRHRLFRQMDKLLCTPIRVRHTDSGRQVVFLETFAYGVDTVNKHVSAAVFTSDGAWINLDGRTNTLNVDTFLCRANWRVHVVNAAEGRLRSYLNAAWHVARQDDALAASREFPATLQTELLRAARAGLQRRIRDRTRVKVLRPALRQALAIEPALLDLARRCRIDFRRDHITNTWMNFIWRHRETLERVQKEVPAVLAPAAELASMSIRPFRDPVERLKTHLLTKGVGELGWQRLLRHSLRPFRVLLGNKDVMCDVNCLALALKLTNRLDPAEAVCPVVWKSLVTLFSQEGTPKDCLEEVDHWPRKIFSECARQARAAASKGDVERFVRDELVPIFNHLLDKNTYDKNQMRAGWKCWLRLARLEESRQRELVSDEAWTSAVANWEFEDFRFESIDNRLGLYDEGVELHHCAHAKANDCATGSYRVYRVLGPGQRATLALICREGRWSVDELRTYCNRQATGRVRVAAEALARQYQQLSPLRAPSQFGRLATVCRGNPPNDSQPSRPPLANIGKAQ